MYVTGGFSEGRFLQSEPKEFSIRIVPEEMEGREVESFICFSRQPESLEIRKGENWVPCSGILGCGLLVEETVAFRASFGETGKVKMDWYCTLEGSVLKEIVQYADVVDPSLPEIECTIPESFTTHEDVEFIVKFLTPAPSDKPRKVQYIFSSMDSVKRIERLVDDPDSSWNGKWLLVDRSQFSNGEMMHFTGEDAVKFKASFLAWGSFKLHVLVDGILQATFPFKVKSRVSTAPAEPREPGVRLEKAPKGCQMSVEADRIFITYPEQTTQSWWKMQARECSGPASPNEAYCTVRFISPVPAKWCRTAVESISGTWTTELHPIPSTDEDSCLWSFPVARKVNGIWKDLSWCRTGTFYRVTVTFCNLEKGVWKEAAVKTWTVKCRHQAESLPAGKVWSSELLYYLRMIMNGCTATSAVKAFGTWHKWTQDRIYAEIMKTQANFGRFALENGLVQNAEEMSAVNWLITRNNPMAQDRLGLYGFDPACKEARSLEAALVRSGWRRLRGMSLECPCRNKY